MSFFFFFLYVLALGGLNFLTLKTINMENDKFPVRTYGEASLIIHQNYPR